MAKSKKSSSIKITSLLGAALVVVMLIMCFLPFFTFESELLGKTNKTTASGFNSIFSSADDKISSDNSDGQNMVIMMYKGDDTKDSMSVLGLAGLAALIAAAALLALNLLSAFGVLKLPTLAKAAGGLLAVAVVVAVIAGLAAAGNATSFDNIFASAKTSASIGLWLFAVLGILAGATPFLKFKK